MVATHMSDRTTLANGVKMPWLGLGVYKMTPQEAEQATHQAIDVGYRSVDTAAFYGNEEGVGKAIRESAVPRADLFVTTKLWNDDQGYDEALRAFDKSQEKLGLDVIDLYLIHWPVAGQYKASWRALEKLYDEGRVRAIGVSNFKPHHLDDLIGSSHIKPMVNQVEYHPYLSQGELKRYCDAHDIQLEAWSPLTRGRMFDHPVLQELADTYQKTPAQIILRWDLQNGVVTIPKTVRQTRMQENADVFDFQLSHEAMAKLDQLNRDHRYGPDPDSFA